MGGMSVIREVGNHTFTEEQQSGKKAPMRPLAARRTKVRRAGLEDVLSRSCMSGLLMASLKFLHDRNGASTIAAWVGARPMELLRRVLHQFTLLSSE